MPRELIIPGVSVQVVKEIVPAPLTPSGVVGMLGTSPRGPILEPTPVTSYREFADKFGADPNYTLTRDVKLAFYNGVFEVFVTRVEGTGGRNATLVLKAAKKRYDWSRKSRGAPATLSEWKLTREQLTTASC